MTTPRTSPKLTFTLLQIFRGWAAVLVIFYHASGIVRTDFHAFFLNNYFEMGDAGVDFFFVLSGFLITHLHLGDVGRPEKLKSYLQKRIIRIYPVYWIVTLCILPMYFIVLRYGLGDETHPFIILKSLLLLPMQHAPILTAGWTLRHEILFYAIFACLIGIRAPWVRHLVLIWAGCILAYVVLFPLTPLSGLHPLLQLVLLPRNLEFLLGCLAAIVIAKTSRERTPLRLCVLGLVVSSIAFAFVGWLPRNSDYFGRHILLYGLLSFVIVVTAVLVERTGIIRESWRQRFFYRILLLIGDASYSIYLIHGPCLSLAFKIVVSRGTIFGMTFTVFALAFITIAGGCLLHIFVEKPLLAGLRRRFMREPRFAL